MAPSDALELELTTNALEAERVAISQSTIPPNAIRIPKSIAATARGRTLVGAEQILARGTPRLAAARSNEIVQVDA